MNHMIGLIFFLLTFGFQSYAGVGHVLKYRDPINGGGVHGWHGPLEDLKESLDPKKNYALIVVHKPYNAFILNDFYMFRQTVMAAREALENPSVPSLGHVQVGWACRYPGQGSNKRYYGFTGQSGEHGAKNYLGEKKRQGSTMLLDGRFGMSLFFANFTDGNLESARYSSNRLAYSSRNSFTWMAVEVSQSQCKRGIGFLNQYIGSKAYKNFSFYLNPKKYQGGGCTSFGSVFAEKLGLFSSGLVDFWNRSFRIPKSLVGNPDGHQFSSEAELPFWIGRDDLPRPELSKLPAKTKLPYWMWGEGFRDNVAGPGKLFLTPFPGLGGNLKTRVYDPELILLTIKSIAKRAQREGHIKLPSSFDTAPRRAYGLHQSSRSARPVGSREQDSYVELKDDFRFFPYMKAIHQYVNKPEIQVPKMKLGRIGKTYVLILEQAAW